jgi:hypothetical protein
MEFAGRCRNIKKIIRCQVFGKADLKSAYFAETGRLFSSYAARPLGRIGLFLNGEQYKVAAILTHPGEATHSPGLCCKYVFTHVINQSLVGGVSLSLHKRNLPNLAVASERHAEINGARTRRNIRILYRQHERTFIEIEADHCNATFCHFSF